MLENIYKSVIELSSLSLFFIMLYWLRRAIGSIPLYVLLGLFFSFAQISQMPGFEKMVVNGSSVGMLGNGILFVPVILMYLTIYEEEGTFEAHRFIISMLISVVGCVYIIQMLHVHSDFSLSFSEMLGFISDTEKFLVPMLVMTMLHLVLFMFIPVSYQIMRNMRIPAGIAMFLHIYAFVLGNNALLVALDYSTDKILPLTEWNISIVVLAFISHFYLKVTCGTITVKKPFAIISTLLEHIQSAGRLRQTVEEWAGRYQTVFDNSLVMIFLVDEQGRILNANHSAVKLFKQNLYSDGFELASVIYDENGDRFDWKVAWDNLHLRDSSKGESGTSFYSMMQLIFSDGRKAFVEFNLSTARQNDRELAIVIMRDTTERYEEEQKRRKLEEQLVHSQKMEAVGVLAGGIAHDFNNLLLGIQASAEVIGMQKLDPKSRAMMDNINSATGRATDLVRKLLGFARKGNYEIKLTNLCNIAQKTADLFTVGLKDVRFKLLLYPEPLMINGDETQLQQAILNLLLNARDALEKDGARKITLRTDLAHEDTRSWMERPEGTVGEPSDYVTLSVKDTGTGMDEATKARVFEPFYTTKGLEGTGLGMSMAYGCVTHHKGWLHILSAPGEGTEITIYLPKS